MTILRIAGLVVVSYLVVLVLLKLAERHITKVISRRSITGEGQRRLHQEYWTQRDKAEAERLSQH